MVSGKWRTIIPVIYQLPFGLGNAVMASLAYWFRDWRKLEFALASLSSIYIIYWLWVPESPRWLLATGQTEKASGKKYCDFYFKMTMFRAGLGPVSQNH